MNNSLMNSKKMVQPTIIAMADSTHYLVGAVDKHHNLFGLEGSGEALKLNSLQEAKQYLRDHNVRSTIIEYQSAYDEMCGTNMSFGCCSQTVSL